MSKHTPGPWTIQPPMIQRTPRWLIIGCGKVVADCGLSETVPHDARLIAAAPDMLEALKRIAYEPQGRSDASHADVLGAVEKIARAAIAKAEGRP